MYRSIVMSCDTYYYQLGNEMGIDAISDFMKQFGFGQPTGIDLEHEKTGVLPSQEWKRARFKRNRAAQKWVGGDTISISHRPGLQQLHHAAAGACGGDLANNGVVMKPHLVKILEDGGTKQRTLTVPKESGRIPLKQENIDVIKRAMVGVTTDQSGTGYIPFRNAGYLAGGKTGTAQVVGLKGAKYNHQHDARTPARQRAVHRLRAGRQAAHRDRTGGRERRLRRDLAAPIARKALDYYLLGKRPGDKAKPADPPAATIEAAAVRPNPRAGQPQGTKE
jgi:penicillin-binding protein 2